MIIIKCQKNQKIYSKDLIDEIDERMPFSTGAYFSLLSSYLSSTRNWGIKKNTEYECDILEGGHKIGTIERKFDAKNKILYLIELRAAMDDYGNRISGKKIVDTIYNFEKDLPKKYAIDFFVIDPVHSVIKRKINEYYGNNEKEMINGKLYVKF